LPRGFEGFFRVRDLGYASWSWARFPGGPPLPDYKPGKNRPRISGEGEGVQGVMRGYGRSWGVI
jgi:hypothetical protein